LRPENEITEDDLNVFLTTIKNAEGYPKIRELRRLLGSKLSLVKINAILRYLEKSKRLEIDLDGNIIWIKEEENANNHELRLSEVATISQDFLRHFSTKNTDTKDDGESQS
jgi:hypothetical protein